ncbi:MAG: permease-like cell division protein FtsX, partial [Oscillospiraceae bacterium]|nr:permease-like cell division protein FtsX [Oscillospiraceae bacterium]
TVLTMTNLSKLAYYFREGIGGIFTHGCLSLATVGVIIACLIIMGSFALLAVNVSSIIRSLEDQNQIIAFVDENYAESEARGLESQIEAIQNVSDAVFESRGEAWDDYVSQYDSHLFEGLDSKVLRDRYIIYLKDLSVMDQTQEQLLGIPGVVKVNAHLEIAQGFITVKNVVSIVSVVLIVVLLIISLFIMANTIKLTSFERREEIAIMKMVGATPAFIRTPFVIEGIMLGLIGSLAAYIAQWALYRMVGDFVLSDTGLSFLHAVSFSAIAIPLLIAFLVVGLAVGIFGSSLAIKNYLKV